MKRRVLFAHGLPFILGTSKVKAAANLDLSGTWNWRFKPNDRLVVVTLRLALANGELMGTIQSSRAKQKQVDHGLFKDGEVSFSVTREQKVGTVVVRYVGRLMGNGNVILGRMEIERGGKTREFPWRAKRSPPGEMEKENVIANPRIKRRKRLITQRPNLKVACTPASLFFGRLVRGERVLRHVELSWSDQTILLDDAKMTCESDNITTKIQINDDHSATLEITYVAPALERKRVEKGLISGTRGEEPILEIPFVAIRVKKRLQQ